MQIDFPSKRQLSSEQREGIRTALDEAIASPTPTRLPATVRPRWVIAFALVLIAGAVGLLAPGVGLLAALSPNEPAPIGLENDWREALANGAKTNPDVTFANLSPSELSTRLDRAARDYGFTVVSLELLKPVGFAPLIVIKTSEPTRVARGVPELLRLIDPYQGSDDKSGWAFEGIFLKAIDNDDKPFLIIYNHWRDPADAGGGQWARSPDLFPFPHG